MVKKTKVLSANKNPLAKREIWVRVIIGTEFGLAFELIARARSIECNDHSGE